MQAWVVIYNSDTFSEELYQRALLVLDHDSAKRVRKFRRREDACRCLIGRLLRYMMLHRQGIDPRAATFDTTKTGKPYLVDSVLSPPIAFNVAHDNEIVTISFSSNVYDPPAYSLGIDVMKVHLTRHDTFHSFIDSMSEVLTPLEYRHVTTGESEGENLQRFFWAWTMKEAFTKAVGSGLGFDLRRVEYDAESETLRVDGAILAGWQFNKFVIYVHRAVYQGVIAQYVGGKQLKIVGDSAELPPYMEVYDAVPFVENALQHLD